MNPHADINWHNPIELAQYLIGKYHLDLGFSTLLLEPKIYGSAPRILERLSCLLEHEMPTFSPGVKKPEGHILLLEIHCLYFYSCVGQKHLHTYISNVKWGMAVGRNLNLQILHLVHCNFHT